MEGATGISILGFISVQDLLKFINLVNISTHPHCRYAGMMGEII
jgi:hypothetical protein